MNKEQLDHILAEHEQWLSNKATGKQADLRTADLRCAQLAHANLREARLSLADLSGADLSYADLSCADLYESKLTRTYLFGANLSEADLYGAELLRADLGHANLSGAEISYASWPLWCGSIRAKVDKDIVRQLLYHVLALVECGDFDSDFKSKLLTPQNVEIANQFKLVVEDDVDAITEAEEKQCAERSTGANITP